VDARISLKTFEGVKVMVGKPRIPDAVKIANGTYRPGRANDKQPKSAGVPKCPFKRGAIAATKWREVVTGLKRLGIIDQIDGTHIEGLSQAYQLAKEADAVIAVQGIVIDGKKNPACTVSADAWAKVRAFGNDLGLNHLSRQRLQALPEPEDTPRMRCNREIEQRYFGA
jgi:P27 family predicted phage terminase small subunit